MAINSESAGLGPTGSRAGAGGAVGAVQANLRFNGRLVPLGLTKVRYIVIHHLAAASATPEQVHQWHVARGWMGAGYNEYIRKDGQVYIMRGDHVGSHCRGYNGESYGIACEGNYDAEREMPAAQLAALAARVRFHRGRLSRSTAVVRHGGLVATACPGKYMPWDRLMVMLEAEDKEDSDNMMTQEQFNEYLENYLGARAVLRPSKWAEGSWAKAAKRPSAQNPSLMVMDGTSPQGFITRQEYAATLDRLGLLDD